MYREKIADGLRAVALRLAVLLAAVTFLGLAAQAQTQRGEKSFGIKAGYESRNTSGLAGLVFQYSFSKHVRIAPQVGVVFRHHNSDAFLADVDVHFPISVGSDRAALYPLVGVAFNSWVSKNDSEEDVTTHVNSLGANAGVGFEYRCMPSMKISIEGRYTVLRHNPNVQVTAGIAYIF